MTKLILYRADETEYNTHGLGVIKDAISCLVKSGTKGAGELFFTYPADGELFDKLQQRNIIYAKPSTAKKHQPYRIYHVTAPLNGRVKVYARHWGYDAGGVVIAPIKATNATDAVDEIVKNAVTSNPFVIRTDMIDNGELDIARPQSLRECLLGEKDSLAAVYGAEFEFDHNHIRMVDRLGGDHGYRIKYGVNLIDAQQEKNSANVYTGIYPYFFEETDGQRTLITLPEKVINAAGSFGFERVLPVDLSSDLLQQPTVEELRKAAQKYVEDHKIGIPHISIDVVFALLREYEEYKDISRLESVELGDDVAVDIPKLGISVKARVIETIYDALADRYEGVTIGDAKNTVVESIFSIENTAVQAFYNAGKAGRGLARVEAKVTETQATVKALAEWRTEATENIASISQKADANEADIDLIAQSVTDNIDNIAMLEARADEQGAQIELNAESIWHQATLIAGLTAKTNEQGAQIDLMAESISENAESIADLNIRADDQGAEIGLIALATEENTRQIAEVNATASKNESNIALVSQTVVQNSEEIDGNTKNIASLGVKTTEQDAQISAKVSKKAGNTSSFGWDLSLTGWQVSANGVPVFIVTKDGAKVIGYIEADAGKIGGFRVASNGLSYGTVFIGNNGVGFGKKPESIEEYETTFTTSIDDTGFLVSSHAKLYNPFLFGHINIGGDPSKGHIVNSAIPFSMPGLILGGHNIADHEARIAALEEAVGTGGGAAKEYNVYILVNYFDADGGLAWSSVEVNGTYPTGTAFSFPEERDLDGVTYINHDGTVTFTVSDADIRATLTYDEKVEEVETYRVQIYIEYQYANGEYKTEKDVDGYFTPGTSWRYPAYTTYDGKSFASEAGEDLDIVVGGTNIDNTIVYVEIESGGGDDGDEYDMYFSVGDTYTYSYGSVAPEITINGSGLSWYDDGGVIEFSADYVGSGSVTIKESDIVLEEWTYIIT